MPSMGIIPVLKTRYVDAVQHGPLDIIAETSLFQDDALNFSIVAKESLKTLEVGVEVLRKGMYREEREMIVLFRFCCVCALFHLSSRTILP